jgi:hypothetical protein
MIQISSDWDKWSLDGETFSTKKLHNLLIGEHPTPKPILNIWKTCNIPRQKLFVWVLLHGRLNTKDMMTRKNFLLNSLIALTMKMPRGDHHAPLL